MPGSRKILRNFHCKVLLNFLRVLDVFLELLSDSKNHVDFLVDEISELGHTVKSLCCRHLENFGSARHRPFQGFFRHLVGGAKKLGRARGQTVKTWRTTVDCSTVDMFLCLLLPVLDV